MELTKERHWELLDSGMYWEWFPEGTGLYLNDKQMIEESLRYKFSQARGVSSLGEFLSVQHDGPEVSGK